MKKTRTDEEIEFLLEEFCENCIFKKKDKIACLKLERPCDLKMLLRCNKDCPIGKWENIDKKEDNGV